MHVANVYTTVNGLYHHLFIFTVSHFGDTPFAS